MGSVGHSAAAVAWVIVVASGAAAAPGCARSAPAAARGRGESAAPDRDGGTDRSPAPADAPTSDDPSTSAADREPRSPSYELPREVALDLEARPATTDPRRDLELARYALREYAATCTGQWCAERMRWRHVTAAEELASACEDRLRRLVGEKPDPCAGVHGEEVEEACRCARSSHDEAVRSTAALARKAPTWPDRDRALLHLAWAIRRQVRLDVSGDGPTRGRDLPRQALRVLEHVASTYPASPILPLARLEIAQIRFDEGETERAREILESLAASPVLAPALDAFVHYRIAWCQLRLGESGLARQEFDLASRLAAGHPDEAWSDRLVRAIDEERPAETGARGGGRAPW
jgi:hypothetical protein